MLISRANIALNAVICMIYFIFTLIMELWLLRIVGFYISFLQSYILSYQQKLKLVMRTVPIRGKGIPISLFSPVTLFAQYSFKPSSDLSEMLLRPLQLEI